MQLFDEAKYAQKTKQLIEGNQGAVAGQAAPELSSRKAVALFLTSPGGR